MWSSSRTAPPRDPSHVDALTLLGYTLNDSTMRSPGARNLGRNSPMLAYFESLHGLVPVKVTGYVSSVCANGREWDRDMFEVTVTASRGAYPRGFSMLARAVDLIPRDAVRRRGFSTYIVGPTFASRPVTL